MQSSLVIGRDEQKALFKEALNSSKSEFVVVYGRRRVGKTFLIKNVLVVSQTNYDKFIWRNLSDYFVGEHPA